VVLDANNAEVGRINLTDHDLAEQANQDQLIALFVDAGAP